MHPQLTLIAFVLPAHTPILDGDYDRFEQSPDLENNCREAQKIIFYHDTLDAA
jgi:hypothetical protein